MITFTSKGNFDNLTNYLEKIKNKFDISKLDKYGKQGVQALSAATPVRTGLTASSWGYKILNENGRISIVFTNSHIEKGTPIAIILQYGHATRNGGWVEGIDYINPTIKPLFEKMTNEMWKEVIG